MKDNAPAALMVFFITVVLLVVLDDLRTPDPDGYRDYRDVVPAMVHKDAQNPVPTDLATTDEFE
jgi:hypothetical protein